MRDWLAARAAATPQREALVFGDERLTFAGLNERVALTCAGWRASGFTPGQHVAMVMHSCSETVTRLFACIRMGLVLVPLGVRQTPAEREGQFRDSGCDWLLPEAGNEPLWRLDADGRREPVAPGTNVASGRSGQELDGQCRPEVPLAIVHTSGTTGAAKGAVLTAGNFYSSAMGATMRLGHLPRDRWLCVMPLWHVAGLALLTRAVLQGAGVVLQPGFDPDRVMDALQREDVTLVSLVPTMLHRLLDRHSAAWSGKLRLILLGGAAASEALLQRSAEARLPLAPTWGLTESCSQVATMLPEHAGQKPGSVGKPLLFNTIRVVSESGSTLPTGQTGQILVRGPTVMREYWNDAGATALALRNGELHTGDLGYLDGDGDLYVVQRRSDLIISGGENVYPAETERVLRAHPAVQDAVVLGLADEEWGQRVAAAVQLAPGARVSQDELLAHCRRRLAGFKVPRQLLVVDRLPRTASGKPSRRKLARLFRTRNAIQDN